MPLLVRKAKLGKEWGLIRGLVMTGSPSHVESSLLSSHPRGAVAEHAHEQPGDILRGPDVARAVHGCGKRQSFTQSTEVPRLGTQLSLYCGTEGKTTVTSIN